MFANVTVSSLLDIAMDMNIMSIAMSFPSFVIFTFLGTNLLNLIWIYQQSMYSLPALCTYLKYFIIKIACTETKTTFYIQLEFLLNKLNNSVLIFTIIHSSTTRNCKYFLYIVLLQTYTKKTYCHLKIICNVLSVSAIN